MTSGFVFVNGQLEFIQELLGAWNSHDPDRVAEFYAADYCGVDISQPTPHSGKEGIRRTLASYWQAFPDFKIKYEETIEQGARIVVLWSAEGTHEGRIMNIPPTGKKIKARGVSVFTIENNLVTHALYFWDVAGLLREIGLLPELAPVS